MKMTAYYKEEKKNRLENTKMVYMWPSSGEYLIMTSF